MKALPGLLQNDCFLTSAFLPRFPAVIQHFTISNTSSYLCIYFFNMGPGFLIHFWFTVHACTSSFLTNITCIWPLEIPSVWYLFSCDMPLSFFECSLGFRHSMVFLAHYVPTLNYLWAQPFLRMNSGSLQRGLIIAIKIWAQNVLIVTRGLCFYRLFSYPN